MDNFQFNILDVADILGLTVRHRGAKSIDVDCPFCGKHGKMNLHLEKNVYRCNYCGEYGGMIALFAKVNGMDNSTAYNRICDSLNNRTAYKTERTASAVPSDMPKSEAATASPQERDHTYRLLFSLLTLSKTHKENLLSRGLSEEAIFKFGYKSTPAFGFTQLTDTLASLGCMMDGVPGFYRKDGRFLTSFCSNCSGIVIPVISIDGMIQGAQIRLDRPINGRKYIWFSSSERDGGVGAGSPTHFIGDSRSDVVYVTEGALKATVAHHLSGKTFAAVAGVNQYSALERLLVQLKSNGTKTIIETYDMDKRTNEHVERGCQRLIELCGQVGLEVKRLYWDDRYKGIDDFLLSKKKQ